MEIHVTQKRVLRHVKADRNRRRIAVADFEIDIAHRRIERPRVGIGDGAILRHAIRRRERHAEPTAPGAPGAESRERHHRTHALLKTRRVGRQRKHRPRRAVTEKPHPRPHKNSPRQQVPPRRHKNDSFAIGFRFIDRRLQSCAVVALPIAVNAEFGGAQIDRPRVVHPSAHRLRRERGASGAMQQHGHRQLKSETCVHCRNLVLPQCARVWFCIELRRVT